MVKLIAKFDIQLPDGLLLVCRPQSEELSYKIKIDGFDVELCLNPDLKIWRNLGCHLRSAPIEEPYFGISKVQIVVARDEDVQPPPVQFIDGVVTSEERRRYLEKRKPVFQKIAIEILNRAILFFKYRLHNPQLYALSPYEKGLQNPTWTDEAGQKLKINAGYGTGTLLPSLTSFSVKGLTTIEDSDLQQALRNPIVPQLYEELLSDAQTAIFQGNLRRGVLEMAISCEVAVKNAFFAGSTIAGIAYEYLESQRKIEVTVPELIHKVAKYTFGESFRDTNNKAYGHIDLLFQCRNKIAHIGKSFYRDNKGIKHEVNYDTLKKWWASVEELIKWLNKYK